MSPFALLLLILAVLAFLIAALIGFGAFTSPHELGWVSAGLAAFAGSFLVGAAPFGPR